MKGEKNKLTPQNQNVINNLCKFIKFNPNLKLLDLSDTGLNEIAIKIIIKAIKKSVSLKTINLTGNNGITEEIVAFARTYLDAK